MQRWTNDGRIRGRAGVELRKRRLKAEPLCRWCAEKGKLRPSTVPDHIRPLGLGGTDTDDNIQCLCEDCHTIKTAAESASAQSASNHPEWLQASAVPLTIVCGPPCSGKTTYIAQRAKPSDTVIDVDAIATAIDPSYRHWTGALTSNLLNRTIRARNALLASLERKNSGAAWFIVSAPTQAERTWWTTKLGGQLVLLNPGIAECKRRAVERGTPHAIDGIIQWDRASRLPWRREGKRQAIGEDGWPID